MTRRPIQDGLKVLIGVVLLGPPIGGILAVLMTQLLPWLANGFPQPFTEFGYSLVSHLVAVIPLSYVFGAHTALLAGLALAAYVTWGGRLTLWACLAAALIYPALVAAIAFFESSTANAEPGVVSAVFGYIGLLAGTAMAAAAVCYFLLRNTWFMRDARRPAGLKE